MAAQPDIQITIGHMVPFLWMPRNVSKPHERFAVETLPLPVTVRGVDPASVRQVRIPVPVRGKPRDLPTCDLGTEIDGVRYNALHGCPLESVTDPTERPEVFGFSSAHLPGSVAPTRHQVHRYADRMRAAAVYHPAEAAAARVRQAVSDRVVHDGRFLYERLPDPGGREADTALARLTADCCDVVQAGDQMHWEFISNTLVPGLMVQLRRTAVLGLIESIPLDEMPAAEALVRQVALILADRHRSDRQQARMSRIAEGYRDLPAPDEESIAALMP